MLLVEVEDRRAVTLEPIIQQYVLPRSHVISDGWATYANIDPIRNGIYVFNHCQHSVNPHNPDIHTINVDNMWMRAKRKLRAQFDTSEQLCQLSSRVYV